MGYKTPATEIFYSVGIEAPQDGQKFDPEETSAPHSRQKVCSASGVLGCTTGIAPIAAPQFEQKLSCSILTIFPQLGQVETAP